MADKKQTSKNIEREYVIPLRKEINKVPRYRKAEKAVKAIKEFLARHMKVYDKDFNKIKLDKYLNQFVWSRGIRNPPAKVKIKATKDEQGIVLAELLQFPDKIKYRKLKLEKRQEKAAQTKKKAKPTEKKEDTSTAKKPEEQEQDKKEKEIKQQSSKEQTEKIEKQQAKQAKHTVKEEKPQPQQRKQLQR